MRKKTIATITGLLVSMLLASTGCKKNPAESEPNSRNASRAKRPWEKPPKVYPLEAYGDPKIFDMPRLQFRWCPHESEKNGIWSIKVDGTDLRRVLPNGLLYTNGHSISATPVRSPDNRYLIVSMFSDGPILKELFDLKTMTVKTIATGGFKPNFQWTPDSKRIIFVLDGWIKEYNLETGELTGRKMMRGKGFYLTKDGKKFYAVTSKGFDIYSFQGKLLKSVEFTEEIDRMFHTVSLDGKYFLYNDYPKTYIVKTDDPKEIIFVDEDQWRYRFAVFDPGNEYFYYAPGTVEKVNIQTKEKEIVFNGDSDYSAGDLTLINY